MSVMRRRVNTINDNEAEGEIKLNAKHRRQTTTKLKQEIYSNKDKRNLSELNRRDGTR